MANQNRLAQIRTISASNADWARIQVALHERIELLQTFINEIKLKPAGSRDVRRLSSLESDLELTTDSLKLICA